MASDQSRSEFETWCLRGQPADAWTNWQLCWQASRRAALEEAAKVCESISQPYAIGESQECAEAIRALAAKTREGDKPFPPKMRSQCNCPCHEPGTFILHCMPCCHPDQEGDKP